MKTKMDTQNNNGKITFSLDADVLNSHIKATDSKSCNYGSCVYISYKDGYTHIKTTNGHILFHSAFKSESDGDFTALFKINKPFKTYRRSINRIVVELGDDEAVFNSLADNVKMVFPIVRNINWPNTDIAEMFTGERPTYYQPFNPKYMQMIVDYLDGTNALSNPVAYKDSSGRELQYKFVAGDDSCRKVAVIMPIRTIGKQK